jgi:3-methyladenine DNA glycosylase AlkD
MEKDLVEICYNEIILFRYEVNNARLDFIINYFSAWCTCDHRVFFNQQAKITQNQSIKDLIGIGVRSGRS